MVLTGYSLDNLVTLCRFHHGLLHKGEYRLHRDSSNELVFTNKSNEVVKQSLYPQFPQDILSAGTFNQGTDALEFDEDTAACKWSGETMDFQMALGGLFQLDSTRPG